ncbi:hypothetical protein AB0B21_10805 [Streptomyces rimosus]|uniref:hypothetical protein n=1 Tax=Streptomyces rimosus TaxID=1927 RepID=UPI00131CAC8A|nr:hypothetical protein [Streptomyces rimosus]
MTDAGRTPDGIQPCTASISATAGWKPDRGDLAYDTAKQALGVVTALPQDTGSNVYHLTPEGGGEGWPAVPEHLMPPGSVAASATSNDPGAVPSDVEASRAFGEFLGHLDALHLDVRGVKRMVSSTPERHRFDLGHTNLQTLQKLNQILQAARP